MQAARSAVHQFGLFHRLTDHAGGLSSPPGVLLVTMVAAAVIEAAWRLWGSQRGYDAKGGAATLVVAAIGLATGAITALVVGACYALAWRLAPFHWSLSDWRTWLVGFGLVEFAYYWFHRLSHRVRWMWATHAVHHTPEQMTLLSAIRLGWTHLLSGGWLVYVPVIIMGFDPRLVVALLAFDLHYQFFLHTEAVGRLGPLEWVLNTPSHHRVHHGANRAYLDKNYGGVVIIFDRIFGSFASEAPGEPIRFGLVHAMSSKNPFVLALGEWRRLFAELIGAESLGAAARIAFGPPR